jgi:hypothetical protein
MERRFEGNDRKPGHSEEEIAEVIRTSTNAVLLVTSLVTSALVFEEKEGKQLHRCTRNMGNVPGGQAPL